MLNMAYLLQVFVLCLLSKLLIAFSLLSSHNIGNMTEELVTGDAMESTDIFRQLLNQEAIIRMTLVQNVHSLMKDMLTIKNSMFVSETTTEKFKVETEKTIFQLKAEVEKLKLENQRLRDNNAEIKGKLIPSVNGTLQAFNDSISQLEKSQKNFEQLLEERLDTKFTQLDSGLQMIEAREGNLSSIVATLETSLSNVSSQVEKYLHPRIAQINAEMIHIQSNLSSFISAFELRQGIGFSAGVSTSDYQWTGSILAYSKVIYNKGDGYDSNTGIFSSPVDGVFVFYISIQSAYQYGIHLDIVLNGESKVRAVAYYDSGSRIKIHQTGTNLVVLALKKGDKVWVARRSFGGGYWSSSVSGTTFSGFHLF